MMRRLVVVLTLVLAVAGCSGGSAGQPGTASPPAGSGSPAAGGSTAAPVHCTSSYRLRPLPAWARSGFHPPTMPMPYVLGSRGDIAAILWGGTRDYLRVPPRRQVANKILWVARVSPGGPLVITATLGGTGRTVTRTLRGGPGPSHVNLPAAGCWTFNLSWPGHHDQLALRYLAR